MFTNHGWSRALLHHISGGCEAASAYITIYVHNPGSILSGTLTPGYDNTELMLDVPHSWVGCIFGLQRVWNTTPDLFRTSSRNISGWTISNLNQDFHCSSETDCLVDIWRETSPCRASKIKVLVYQSKHWFTYTGRLVPLVLTIALTDCVGKVNYTCRAEPKRVVYQINFSRVLFRFILFL